MAQAIDLPEPKHDLASGGTSSANNASADDLLSQLAGDEIDKLLAEAEIEKPAKLDASPAPEAARAESQTLTSIATSAEVADASIASSVDNPNVPSESPLTVNSADKQAQSEAAVSAELDELFKELNTEPSSSSVSSAASANIPPAPQSTSGISSPSAASPNVSEVPTSDQERAALDATANEDLGEIVDHDHDESEAKVPFYLKPLEWLNYPLTLIPEPSRDLVGKVAIISFMNAISVLVYLLIFRKS